MCFCSTNRLSTQERPTHQRRVVTHVEQESVETADLSRTPALRVRSLDTRHTTEMSTFAHDVTLFK